MRMVSLCIITDVAIQIVALLTITQNEREISIWCDVCTGPEGKGWKCREVMVGDGAMTRRRHRMMDGSETAAAMWRRLFKELLCALLWDMCTAHCPIVSSIDREGGHTPDLTTALYLGIALCVCVCVHICVCLATSTQTEKSPLIMVL